MEKSLFRPGCKPYAGFLIGMLWLLVLVCLCQPVSSRAATTPLMAHAAWQRVDALVVDFPFAWARRYLELKSIAEDTDSYGRQLPFQLKRLREITADAQKDVVTLLLDMVPAQANVQETTYLLGLLENWSWKLEPPLRRTAAAAAGVQQALEVLAGIGLAVEELQANTQKRPIMEKANQDLYDLYTLVHQHVYQLHADLNAVRSAALGLYKQIENTVTSTEAQLPEKWIDYYSIPLVVSSSTFSRFESNFLTMCENWTYDDSYPSSLPFAIIFNSLIVFSLVLLHTVISRGAASVPQMVAQRTFVQSLCCVFHTLDSRRQIAFGICVAVMMNSILDTLPQFHGGIPFIFVPQLFMALALALWMRSSSEDPAVWELALPIVVGQLLLHGDAGPLLFLLGMGGSMLVSLVSLLHKHGTDQSVLGTVWLAALIMGLLLTVMGFGRITVPLLMLVMTVKASMSMLRVVNGSPALVSYTMARAWFVPLFTVFLFVMSVSFLVACSGLGMLRNYWYANAVPILGLSVTFGNAILTLLFLLSILFISNISRQILEDLGRDARMLDSSAVPVLHVVINCVLAGIFGCFIMSTLGVDVSSLAFIGGGVSIGVGFAAKTILSNFFCGLVIIFSKVVRAGDMVEVNGVSGRVLNVNMRATVVETNSNGILLVPNEELLDSRLTNWSLNNLHVREDIAVSVSPESDMNTVLSAMEEAAKSVSGVLQKPQPKALFTEFGNESMDFVLKVWVRDVRNKAETLSEVRKALFRTLTERGVLLSMLATRRFDICMKE